MRSAIRQDCILRGELKGHWHKFEGLKYPFKRTTCFHARRARAYALQQGWISQGDVTVFEDFWSEGDYKASVEGRLASFRMFPLPSAVVGTMLTVSGFSS